MSQHRRTQRTFDIYMDFWHRRDSLHRFVGRGRAQECSMIDIDSVEYCWMCYEPLVLIELKRKEEEEKIATVTANLARRAGLSAYLVVYSATEDDIESFEVHPWNPKSDLCSTMNAQEYADWLWSFRRLHVPVCAHPAAEKWLLAVENRP